MEKEDMLNLYKAEQCKNQPVSILGCHLELYGVLKHQYCIWNLLLEV